jgi:hypothetical protein
VTALLNQRVCFLGLGFNVCWRVTSIWDHGYRLSLQIEHELVKKCNTF